MDADSELKPSGDGPTAARDDVAPARARGNQLRERLVRALLSAQISKSIPEEKKNQSIVDILRLLLESYNVGYLDYETTISMVEAYLAAQKTLVDKLIQLGANPVDLEIAQAAIRDATLISIKAGSASPTQASSLKRFLMQKQVANSRAKKASKNYLSLAWIKPLLRASRINYSQEDLRRTARGPLMFSMRSTLDSLHRPLSWM
jgi:hypothetical protein